MGKVHLDHPLERRIRVNGKMEKWMVEGYMFFLMGIAMMESGPMINGLVMVSIIMSIVMYMKVFLLMECEMVKGPSGMLMEICTKAIGQMIMLMAEVNIIMKMEIVILGIG